MQSAIAVEGLGKCYVVATTNAAGIPSFRDHLASLPGRALSALTGRGGAPSTREHWALRDVGFSVAPGEFVGILGSNGAGKSTLLKVLGRVTAPTEGKARLRGRVASLLEVGTGFSPDLTGRENIYLSGAILGMGRAEVRRQFDAIVAFAGIDAFLDVPVKNYSSGMYTRLAFAVAAHIVTEIAFIDEVLAVGDFEFQRKCVATMEASGRAGRTTLFVSHNIPLVQSLCPRSIVLEHGRLVFDGPTGEAVSRYLRSARGAGAALDRPLQASGEPTILRLSEVELDESVTPSLSFSLRIASRLSCALSIDVRLQDELGVPVAFGSAGVFSREALVQVVAGERLDLRLKIPLVGVAAGRYSLSLDLTVPDISYFDRVEGAHAFDFAPAPCVGESRPLEQAWRTGSFRLPVECRRL